MTVPLPSVPKWQGSATTASPSTTKNPGDIWDLGAYYSAPILLGFNRVPNPSEPIDPRLQQQNNGLLDANWSNAQTEMNNAAKLWSHQTVERAKNGKGSLTQFEQLQQDLYVAGMYGSTSYNDIKVGQWDSGTQGAMKKALENYEQFIQSTQQPMTFSEFLKNQASTDGDGGYFGQKGKGLGSTGTTVPQVNLTDPAAIRSAAQSAAQQALGQGLSQDQLNAFVTQFQAAQQSDQQSLNPVATTPDLSSQALAFAEQQNPNAYKQHQVQSYVDTLLNMFLPSESSRPNMTPVASVGGSS